MTAIPKHQPIRNPKYGRAGTLSAVARIAGGKYRCKCDCGQERIVRVGHFNAGNAKRCNSKCPLIKRWEPYPCSVAECRNLVCNNRGFCWMHYTRLRRHGDVHSTQFGKPQLWLENHVSYAGVACLKWPFGGRNNGYGTLVFDGDRVSAHRKMCELALGSAPSSIHEAAHDCGQGHNGCVNPNHLVWKTPTENQADKILHGTHNRGERNPGAVLCESDVLAMRCAYTGTRGEITRIAKRFGYKRQIVSAAISGRTWGWLK